MSAANKWDYLYELEYMNADHAHADQWNELILVEQELALFVEDRLRHMFNQAFGVGDNGAVAYLLEAGMPLAGMPTDPGHSWESCQRIAIAVDGNNWALARLLRRHGAAMNALATQRVWLATDRAAQEPGATRGSLMTYLRDFSDDQLAPVPAYVLMDYYKPERYRVCTSWPPSAEPPIPPEHATTLPSNIVETIRELWREIGNVRRAEAKMLRRYNWAKVRRGVRARAIAIYWQGVTHEAQCAPNGTGRAADLMAYRAEFAVAA